MDKIRLGRTGMMVARLGFGGIPIQRISEDEAVEVVRRCIDLGVTFLDTANGYTTSEERIGKAVKGRRDEVFIATKSGSRNREGLEKHLKLSLERLGTDYIDLFQFHGISDFTSLETILDPRGPMAVVEDAVDKAASCTECGDCEEQCPYELPIREMLAEQVRYFQEAKERYEQRTGA